MSSVRVGNFPIRIPAPKFSVELMLNATRDVEPEPGQGSKEVIDKATFGAEILDIIYNSGLNDFDYGANGVQSGELPNNEFMSIRAEDQSSGLVFELAFFEPLTFAELAALDTLREFTTYFFSGSDTLTGGDGPDQLRGYGGDDRISAGSGRDTLDGGPGKDMLDGGLGADRVNGGGGADNVNGGDGNDRVLGGASGDRVSGGAGDDQLFGGPGDDRLTGGFGRDTLTGGSGADDFVYQTLPAVNGQESGSGARRRDVITDFRPGVDDIDVSFILPDPFDFIGGRALSGLGQIRVRAFGDDTLVQISTDSDSEAELSILLEGRLRLSEGDFVV